MLQNTAWWVEEATLSCWYKRSVISAHVVDLWPTDPNDLGSETAWNWVFLMPFPMKARIFVNYMSSVLSVGLFWTKIIALLFSPVYTMTPSVDKPLGLNTSCSSPLKSLIMLTSGHLKIAMLMSNHKWLFPYRIWSMRKQMLKII